MTLHLDGLIEHWENESLLFVRALPGFQVSGTSAADLRGKSGTALQSHLDWLVDRELIDHPGSEVVLHIAEEEHSSASGKGPQFAADLIPPGEEEIESALAVGRAALSDLIDAYEAISDEFELERATRTLGHVAEMDRWYASRLSGTRPKTYQGNPVDTLVAAGGAFEDAVDEFAASSTSVPITRDDEEWTLAKVLRRRTGHLREHLPGLQPHEKQGNSIS